MRLEVPSGRSRGAQSSGPAPQSHHRHYDAIRRFPGVQPHPRTTDTPERCHLGIDLFIFLHLNKKPDLLPFFFFFRFGL